MTTIKVKDKEFKVKEGLDEMDYVAILEMALDTYMNGYEEMEDNVRITSFNPISMRRIFFRALMSICMEGYSEDEYEKYFEYGLHTKILDEVINARDAYNDMLAISKEALTSANIINTAIERIIGLISDKMPDAEGINKFLENMPKDLKDTLSHYEQILHLDNKSLKKDEN